MDIPMNRRAFLRRAARPAQRVPAAALPEPQPLRIDAGLEPHTLLLDERSAGHLLRRAGFGASPERLAAYVGRPAAAVADELVAEALAMPLPEPPPWINEVPPPRNAPDADRQAYNRNNRRWRNEWVGAWFGEMHALGLRERLALFWHNHFVTELQVYQLAIYAYRYVTLLRTHALGNFKTFVHAAGLDPAMLLYLNGRQNRRQAPNENYARELLELFTMGQLDGQGNENYTQQDIEEIARALTGWVIADDGLGVVLVPRRFDDGQKTVFGRTGNFGYDDVIDLLFEERPRQIAEFVCRKLYREFVYAAPDEALVAELADIFVVNDFELAPVLSALLGSAYFFDEQVAGARLKSPVELLVGLLLDLEVPAFPDLMNLLRRFAGDLQQNVLNPPNVAGWEGHHAWLTTTTFVARWNFAERMLDLLGRNPGLDLVTLAERLHDPNDPEAAFTLPAALAEHLLPVPLDLLDLQAPAEEFAGDLAGNPLPEAVESGPAYVRDLAKVFLAGTPWYEWNLYREDAPTRLLHYLAVLVRIPEFQLT